MFMVFCCGYNWNNSKSSQESWEAGFRQSFSEFLMVSKLGGRVASDSHTAFKSHGSPQASSWSGLENKDPYTAFRKRWTAHVYKSNCYIAIMQHTAALCKQQSKSITALQLTASRWSIPSLSTPACYRETETSSPMNIGHITNRLKSHYELGQAIPTWAALVN